MKIQNSFYITPQFKAKKEPQQDQDQNPVSKLGERENLLKATFLGGLVIGGRALWFLIDNNFMFEDMLKAGKKIVDKNNGNLKGPRRDWAYLTAGVALMFGFVSVIAALYTLYQSPKIMYEGKVNAFKKGKDMDVYIKGNKVERELYDQMNDKAKGATKEEKEELSQQYLKLRAAKNAPPDFVQNQK